MKDHNDFGEFISPDWADHTTESSTRKGESTVERIRAARPFKSEDTHRARRLKRLTMAASGIAVKSPEERGCTIRMRTSWRWQAIMQLPLITAMIS